MRGHILPEAVPCGELFSRDSGTQEEFNFRFLTFLTFLSQSRKYKCTANEVRTTGYYSCADVIKKISLSLSLLSLSFSSSFQRIFNFRGILFYHSVVIRTEIITTVACTIMRRLGPPTANYETPNSGSKLWSVRYGRSLAPGLSLLWRSKVPQLSQSAYEIAYYNNLSLISARLSPPNFHNGKALVIAR